MKKLLLGSLLLVGLMSVASAVTKYECSRYVNGKYEGKTNVRADSKAEAEQKAWQKYQELGKKVHDIKCSPSLI